MRMYALKRTVGLYQWWGVALVAAVVPFLLLYAAVLVTGELVVEPTRQWWRHTVLPTLLRQKT